jgi:hypothetical protein
MLVYLATSATVYQFATVLSLFGTYLFEHQT